MLYKNRNIASDGGLRNLEVVTEILASEARRAIDIGLKGDRSILFYANTGQSAKPKI